MAFPDQALDVAVELKLGTWTDITRYVFTRDPITITRGRQDEGAQPDPTQCTLTINNSDGRFSPRNPLGPYYGVLGRNTPLRVRVGGGANQMALQVPDTAGSSASTPDTAAIDITGDLDVRVDADVQWVGDSGGLIGKYVEAGNQRSWILWNNGDGKLTLYWSTDGGNLPSASSTAAVPVTSGRLAVRVTLDVDNGASGRTVRFYTAPTNAGPWTQLGAAVVQSGTTSVFNSTSPLQVGEVLGRVAGNYYATEVRSGIGGTVVANPNFNARAKGTTGFTDGAGRVWTVNGEATISDWVTRFHGEVPAWPIRWDTSGANVWVRIEASGISRRLAQGAKPLRSALYRALTGATQKITAYWPLEDGSGATRAASAFPGGLPLKVSGQVTFTDEPAGGTAGGATFGDGGRLTGVTPSVGGTGEWLIMFWLDLPADMGTDGQSPYLQWRTPGSTGVRWYCYTSQALNGQLVLEVADNNNTNLLTIGGVTDLRGRGPTQVAIRAFNYLGDLQIRVYLNGTDGEIGVHLTGDTASTPTSIGINTDITTTGIQFSGTVSHLLTAPLASWDDGLASSVVAAGLGYQGETAGNRILRLLTEESIAGAVTGDPATTEPMGAQQPLELLTLLNESADADGGTLTEQRESLGFAYRPRVADYNSPAAVTLDYTSQVAAPLEPVDDDQQTRNDVTVQRTGGSSARVTLDVGTLSTQPPPNGVGVYNEQVTLNLATDEQTLDQAGWRVHLGTVDEARYPVVRVKLHKHPELIDQVVAMDLRSRIHLTGLPAWEPPGTVDLIADGYTETIEPLRWTIEFNTVPGSPWRVAVTDDPVLARVETDGSQLAAAATATATGLAIASTAGTYWTTDPAQAPFDVTVGGEIVTATAVADAVNDSFARTVASGWGTSPDGRAWTVDGTASNYSVSGGQAAMSFAAANSGLFGYLDLTSPALDIEGTFRTLVAPLTGGGLYSYLLGHVQPGGTGWYALRARLGVDGGIYLALETGPPSFTALTGEEQVAGLTVTANAWLRARLRIQAGTIAAKLWGDGTAEPLEWSVTATDTTLTSGMPGLRAFLIGGNTNTKPFVVQFGELIVHNPQLMTVTRGTNGITKPLTAGTAVRLAQSPTIAL